MRLRKAEAAVQDAHAVALREALVAVEELADVDSPFLQRLYEQLESASPLMARCIVCTSWMHYIRLLHKERASA